MSMCGVTIKQKVHYTILTMKSKIGSSKESCELIDMETLRSKIPDAAFNFKDFQEPLIALNK